MLRRLLISFVLAAPLQAQQAPDWGDVGPLFAARCVLCHSGDDAPLNLKLTDLGSVLRGSENGPVVLAGQPAESPLLQRLRGQAEPRMPLDGPPFLTDDEIALVAAWVEAGMPAGEAGDPATPPARPRPGPGDPVVFGDVRPIFLKRCAKCHSDNSKLGAPPEGLRLDTLKNILAGGERLAVVPGNPGMSQVWRRVAGLGRPRMPFDGPPWLSDEDIRLIGDWIAQGARDDTGKAAPVPSGRKVRLRGRLTGPNEIDGAAFRVGPGTRIRKPPSVGGPAEMRGIVQPDGSVLATRLRRR